MATILTPSEFGKESAKVTAVVELGPESRALLRRMLEALEALADIETVDPGKASEADSSDQTQYAT